MNDEEPGRTDAVAPSDDERDPRPRGGLRWLVGLTIGLLAGLLTHPDLRWGPANWFGPPGPTASWMQGGLVALVVVGLFGVYGFRQGGRFLGPLLRFLHDHLIQAAFLALVFSLVWCLVGKAFGVPDVIWSESGPGRIASAMGATLVLALIGINAYYLDPDPEATHTRIAAYMRRYGTDIGFDRFLEPRKPRGRRLGLFLRAARLPFLILLVLPALFPLSFPSVPRLAPDWSRGDRMTAADRRDSAPSTARDDGPTPRPREDVSARPAPAPDPAQADVTRSVGAYLQGLAAWLAGILLGVFLIKLALALGDRLFEFTDPVTRALEEVAKTFRSNLAELGRAASRGVQAAWEGLLVLWFRLVPDQPAALAPAAAEVAVAALTAASPAPDPDAPALPAQGPAPPDPDPVPAAAPVPDPADLPAQPAVRESQVQGLFAFVAVFATFYVSFSTFAYPWVSPGLAIFLLIGFLAMANALFRKLVPLRWRVAVLAAGLLWITWANSAPFKLQFDNLSYDSYDDRTTLAELARYDPRIEEAARALRADRDEGPAARLVRAIRTAAAVLRGDRGEARALIRARDGRGLVDNGEALTEWRRQFVNGPKPKLAIVCCSGGGARGALWAATVLGWLDDEMKDAEMKGQGFRRSLRLISASSAGSVGAAHYVQWLHDHSATSQTPKGGGWVEEVPRDSLGKVAPSIALRELWRMFTPGEGLVPRDRGKELEGTWPLLRELPLEELREAERTAALPSLVIVPVIPEDGRRLFISNLDLATFAWPSNRQGVRRPSRSLSVHRGSELIFPPDARKLLDVPAQPPWSRLILGVGQGLEFLPEGVRPDSDRDLGAFRESDPVYSVTGVEFAKVFAREKGFRVATAARMAATFPFITPAIYLPSEPAVRVVDSGYRDNYGVNLAADWIFQNREWLVHETSGVVVIQVRSGDPEERLKVREEVGPRLFKGFQLLTSVPEAAGHAFTTSAIFRNDQAVGLLGKLLNDDAPGGGGKGFFTTVVFEVPATLRRPPVKKYWPGGPELEVWHEWGASAGTVSWALTSGEARSLRDEALLGEDDARALSMAGPQEQEKRRRIITDLKERLGKVTDPDERFALLWEYDRALNFERLQALKAWWTRSAPQAPRAGGGSDGP